MVSGIRGISDWKEEIAVATSHQLAVSVVMPVYNGEAFLCEAIQSIQHQGHDCLEIILVDDGSEDGTARIASEFGKAVHYVYQENRGAAAARNRGLKTATGDVIAFLDADDLWCEKKLARQLQLLISDPLVDMVHGYTQRIRSEETENGVVSWQKFGPAWPALSFGSSIMRKAAFDKVGYLDETMAFNEDVDWFVRAREASLNTISHDDLVQLYRRHENNITRDRKGNKTYLLKALKNSIDRAKKQDPEQQA